MTFISSKKWHLWVSIAAIVFFGFLLSRDALARFAWQNYGRADVALIFVRSDAGLAMRLGNYYFNGGAYNLDRAAYAYRRALNLNPDIRLAHYQLGRIAFLKGYFTAAMEEIGQEIALNPELPNTFYVRGLIGGYQGRYAEAERDFQIFIDRIPSNWAGYNDLAWILVRQEKFSEAADTIRLAFERYPDWRKKNPWLWTSYGVSKMSNGDYLAAREAFGTALEITTNMTPEYFWSAYPGNDPRQAPGAFSQFTATLYFNLGIAHENLGELEKAKEMYEKYLATPSKPQPDQTAMIGQKIKLWQ